MPDLRERFARLDELSARDVWVEAVQRAAARQGEVATIPVERGRSGGQVSGASRLRGGAGGPDPRSAPRPLRLFGLPAYAVIAALLAAALVGSLLVAGGYLHFPRLGLGFVPGPSTSAPATALPPASEGPVASRPPVIGARAGQIARCPHSTGFADIVDTFSGHLIQSWQSADVNANGEASSIVGNPDADGSDIAVIGLNTDGRPNAVYLLAVDGSTSCVLAELPSGFTARELVWSRAGDALAIGGATDATAEVYVWSAIGMSRVWTGSYVPHIDWEPNGADLLLVSDHVSLVSMFGTSTALDPVCDSNLGCGTIERGLWSPNGEQVAFEPAPGIGDGQRLVVMDVANRDATTYGVGYDFSILSWNDDHSFNLLGADGTGGHVLHFTLSSPTSTTVHGAFPSGEANAAFNAAGTWAAFLPLPGSHDLTFRNDRDDDTAIPLSISASVNGYQWSPSGIVVAYATSRAFEPNLQTIAIHHLEDPSTDLHLPGTWVLLDFRSAAGVAVGSWRPAPPVAP